VTGARQGRFAVALLVLVAGVMGILHWPHGPSLGADDHGQYLLHARALVEGRAYTDIGFIHTPYSTLVAPIAEPPGAPALIAVVFATLGETWSGARAILYAAFALLGLAVFGYWRRTAGTVLAAVIAAWTLVALGRVHSLDTMLADLPFCVALWATFLLADRGTLRGKTLVVLLAAAGGAAFAFRMAALPLLPAALTAVLLRQREERAAFLIAGAVWTAVAVAVMWGLPSAAVLGSETLREPAAIASDVVINVRAMWDGAREWVPVGLPHRRANLALHLTMIVVAAIGALVALRAQPRRFAYLVAAWYLLMLVALPTRAQRYMWPLYPLMSFAFLTGARWLAGRVPALARARAHVPGVAAVTIVLVTGIVQDAAAPAPRTFNALPDVQQLREVLSREDGGSGRMRVVVFSPRVMSWEAGFTTMAMFDAPADDMLRVMRDAGITHVVAGDAGTHTLYADGIPRLIERRPEWFREVHRSPTFQVFAFADPATR
jgi:hypothetical protein